MKRFTGINNIRTGKRLGLGFGLIVLIIIIIGSMGYYGLWKLSNSTDDLTNRTIPALQALATLNYQRMIIRGDTLEVLLTEHQEDRRFLLNQIIQSRQRSWDEVDSAWEEFLSLPRLSYQEEGLVTGLESQYRDWRTIYVDLDQAIEELSFSTEPQGIHRLYQEYQQLVSEMIPISDAMGETFEELTHYHRVNTDLRIQEDLSMASSLNRASILIFILGVILSVYFALIITSSVKNPILNGVKDLTRISQGDLTLEISGDLKERRDEIGDLYQALQTMILNLTRQIGEMASISNELASFSREIAASVSQVTSGAQETNSSVMETTTTLEEVVQTAEATSQKAREVAENAREGLQLAHASDESMEDMASGMQRISTQMTSIARTIMDLSEQTQTIGDIISTVDDIAEQSNLLAVNAAVEAARAGEEGKGFGVVAQEIRTLAEQSKQATHKVRLILRDIQKVTGEAVMATEQGSKAVEQGEQGANAARESIQALNKRFAESVQSAAQIAAANKEQLIGMDQVAGAMESIKEASSQNVESMKQLEEAARTLKDLGNRLTDLMDTYQI